MGNDTPPFEITPKITELLVKIGNELGRFEGIKGNALTPQLQRENRVQTIQASLAIEQNTLSLEQVSNVIEGKTVRGMPHEILEVKNAFSVYGRLEEFDPSSSRDLLKTHRILMDGLINSSGKWRTGNAGIMKGKEVVHMAPPAENISSLMKNLLLWLKQT